MERIDLLYAARSDELKVRKGLRGIYSVYCTLNVTQSGTVYQVNAALKTGYWNRSLWYLKTTCSSEQAAAAKFQWILGNLPLAIAEGSGNSKFYSFLNCRADDECVHKALEEWGRLLAAEKFLTWPLIDTTHGEQELAQGLVTMGVGRHLVTLLESGQALSPESAAGLARYFSQAPLKVGYWGPYKRLIKLLETRPSDAQWLGIALGRLDSHDTRWSESDVDLKNYDVGIPDTVPSEETIIYMVRRGRRHLRRLSRTQPEEYVRCALGIFHHPSDVELDHRWILADILYARGTKDFHCGRWRALQLPAPPARYNRRWDRAPEIWDQHLDQVRRLWVENSDQTDIQVWAFWVLNDHPQPLPELPAKPLALALLSPSSQLQLFACQQISVHPAILLELPEPAVRAFLSTCTEGQLDTVLPFLVAHSGCLTIQEALLAYVRQVALPNISPNAISLSPAFRATRLLSFALRYLLPNLHANELAPLAHCLGHLT
ncbi:MAG: hypothetical protein EOM92_14585, partial [Gammaproteobacteria bacterium]|nr:hypothetical protein [Gammaproteobacteria bacterium]